MNNEPPIDILENFKELFALITSNILSIFPGAIIIIVTIFLLIIGLLFFALTGTVPSYN